MATTPLVARILSSSVSVANSAGAIIRDVLQKGDLGIVQKEVNMSNKKFLPENIIY